MDDRKSDILLIIGCILLFIGTLAVIFAFIAQIVLQFQINDGIYYVNEWHLHWSNYFYLGVFPQTFGVFFIGMSCADRD